MGWFTDIFKGIGDAISAVGDAICDGRNNRRKCSQHCR